MNNRFPYSFVKAAVAFLKATLMILFVITNSAAQSRELTDGTTPLGITPGSPASSFAISGFDTINPYNGNLNFRLPLLSVGGRGSAQHTITLPIDRRWTVRHEFFNQSFYRHYPEYGSWKPAESRYMPGTLIGRIVGEGPCYSGGPVTSASLTRLTFTTADGTEVELLDTLTGGRTSSNVCGGGNGASRGTVFVTTDGSAATFVSNATIYDQIVTRDFIYPSGYLVMRDGTRYKIDGGKVSWIRDNNGNLLLFNYDATHPFGKLTKITDSLNREVNIAYGVTDGQYGLHDQIIYKGFGGGNRVIRISYSNLADALRSDQTLKTFGELFGIEDYGGLQHNIQVVSSSGSPMVAVTGSTTTATANSHE